MEHITEPDVSMLLMDPAFGASQAVLDSTEKQISEDILRAEAMESAMMKFFRDSWHQDINVARWTEVFNQMEDKVKTSSDNRTLKALNQLMREFQKWYLKTYHTKNLNGISIKVFEEWIQILGYSMTCMNSLRTWRETFEDILFEVWTNVKKNMQSSLLPNTTNTSTSSTTVSTEAVIADARGLGKLQIGKLIVDPLKKKMTKKVSFGIAKKAHCSKTMNIEESDDSGEEKQTTQKPKKKRGKSPSESEESDSEEEIQPKKKKNKGAAAYAGMLDALVNRVSSTNTTAKICSSIYTQTDDDYITLKSEDLSGDIQIKLSISKLSAMKQFAKPNEWKAAHYRSTVLCSSKDSSVAEALEHLQTVLLLQMEKSENITISHGKPGSWNSGSNNS